MKYLLKDSRGADATPIEEREATNILRRLRHQGRRLVEIFVLDEEGKIERFQERTRRRLGSNAIASRTWLCETFHGGEWEDGRYIQEPQEAIGEMDPGPQVVVLVLQGAEGEEEVVPQLESITVSS